MSEYKTIRVIITGRVQGVGFRYFAEDRAQTFDIKGYVKNIMDNKVEVVCQGDAVKLELFILEMKKGPAFAQVKEVQIEEILDSSTFDFFEVRY